MKYFWGAVFFFILGMLAAQERSGTAIYIPPTVGGTAEERAFFDENMAAEVAGANYGVAATGEGADYTLYLTVDPAVDSSSGGSLLTMILVRNSDSEEIVRFSWEYREVEEMWNWNLYLIYNAMANVTLTKPEAEGSTVEVQAPSAEVSSPILSTGWERGLYLGLRGGVALISNTPQVSGGYESGLNTGVSGEGGVIADIRLFRFLSFQAEAVFAPDALSAAKIVTRPSSDGKDVTRRSVDSFTSMSLIFPFLIKIPLGFEKFILGPYAGLYFTTHIGKMKMEAGDSVDNDAVYSFRVNPPLGFTVGGDVGFSLGPGELFFDLRYSRDFGVTSVQNGLQYTRERISASVGYKFGLFRRPNRSKTKVPAPAESAEPAEPVEPAEGEGQ